MSAAATLGAAPEEATLANQKNVAALSQVRPEARTDKQVDSLVLSTRQLDAFANLSAAEHGGLAKVWTHDQLGGGEYLCRVNGMEPAYFIVVSGAMEVESQRLSHNLGENDVTVTSTNSMRTTVVGVGMAFGQYPLLHDTAAVDYSAKAAPCGCGVLRVGKNHYAGLLRRHEEKVLGEAVRMLRASPFFSDWTVASLERLYFILERRRLQPGVDVVTQGDIADFCFIIASGKCDLVVNPPTGPERFITQLPAGALVGEAGLLSETGLRNATVRAAGKVGEDAPIEVLVLSKESFLELDEATLKSIHDTSQYNSACSKEPQLRTESDLAMLQQRTAHLDYCKQLPPSAQHELCRVMRFRKFEAGATLYERGGPATKLFVIISGQAAVYAAGHEWERGRELKDFKGARSRRASKVDLFLAVTTSEDVLKRDPKARPPSPAKARRASIATTVAAAMAGRLPSPPANARRRSTLAGIAVAATAASQATAAAGGAPGQEKQQGQQRQHQQGAGSQQPQRRASFLEGERHRPTSVLEPGDVAGEGELLFEEGQHSSSLAAITDIRVMEVERDDFNVFLKPHRAGKLGELYNFLQGLAPLAGLSPIELHALGKLAVPHGIGEGQLCLASVPHAVAPLGAIPYSRDTIYIIRSGEARLLCSLEESIPEESATATTTTPERGAATTVLANRALEAALGKNAPLASLGPTEVISTDLLSGDASVSDVPWCLQPRAHTELLLFPRREWDSAIRASAATKLRDLAVQRALFLQQRLEDARRETVQRLGASPVGRRMSRPLPGTRDLVFVNGVPAVEPARRVLRASESAPALQSSPALHTKGMYSGDQVGRASVADLRRDLEAQRQYSQHTSESPPRLGLAALPAISPTRDGALGAASSTGQLAWRDGVPVYGSRPASRSTPLAASLSSPARQANAAGGFPEDDADWNRLEECTMPMGDTELELGPRLLAGLSMAARLDLASTPQALRRNSDPTSQMRRSSGDPLRRSAGELARTRSCSVGGSVSMRPPERGLPAFSPSAFSPSRSQSGAGRRSKSYGTMVPQPRSLMAEMKRNMS